MTGCEGCAGLTGKLTGRSDADKAAEGGLEIVVMLIVCVELRGTCSSETVLIGDLMDRFHLVKSSKTNSHIGSFFLVNGFNERLQWPHKVGLPVSSSGSKVERCFKHNLKFWPLNPLRKH